MADLLSSVSPKEESNISRMATKDKTSASSGAGSGGQNCSGNAAQKTNPVANVNWYLRKLKSQSAVVYATTGFVWIAAMFL